jgi:hypothetical protein
VCAARASIVESANGLGVSSHEGGTKVFRSRHIAKSRLNTKTLAALAVADYSSAMELDARRVTLATDLDPTTAQALYVKLAALNARRALAGKRAMTASAFVRHVLGRMVPALDIETLGLDDAPLRVRARAA